MDLDDVPKALHEHSVARARARWSDDETTVVRGPDPVGHHEQMSEVAWLRAALDRALAIIDKLSETDPPM